MTDAGRIRLVILGCTGSIGQQALDVCRQHPDRIEVVALSAHSRTAELVAAAREFNVPLVAVTDNAHTQDPCLSELPKGTKLLTGVSALAELADTPEADTVLVAVVGAVGLEASYHVLKGEKRLALANKESLVVGGDLLMPMASAGQLLPVDSEHSAIFQCLLGERAEEVYRIWLTCSGGPFFGRTRAELESVTRADALAHPTWNMGAKITIDSATLMNKGFERIEAMQLFGLPVERIPVLIQRESRIHSMVEYCDGAVIAHLGASDMSASTSARSPSSPSVRPTPRPSRALSLPRRPRARAAPRPACSTPPTRLPWPPSLQNRVNSPISTAAWLIASNNMMRCG